MLNKIIKATSLIFLVLLFTGMAFADTPPRIVAVPECVIFYAVESGNSPAGQNFKISNGGGGTLNYTVDENASWLVIDKTSGSVSVSEDTVKVTVDSAGLIQSNSPYSTDITIINISDTTQKKIVKVRLSIISPESYAKTYAYDQNGNLARRVTPNGDIIEYKYDALNRLTNIYYPDGSSAAYTYDKNSNRLSMADKTGTTNYEYDIFNRLIAVYYPNVNPIIYDYDKTGNVVKIEYPDHSTISYTYNEDNKLTGVTDSTGVTLYTYYTDTGLLHTKVLPNGVVTAYTYDSSKRIIDVDNKKSDNTIISNYRYTYDANGNIHTSTETISSAKTTEYTYDKLNRLIEVKYPDERGAVSYTYDPAGNRLAMITPAGATNYKYDSDNRLIRAGKEIFFYDRSGNLIKKASKGNISLYTYDYDNRLIGFQDKDNIVEYAYDGDGNRVFKTVNGVKTAYINDILRNPVQVIMETDANLRVTKIYRYGLDRLSQEEL